MVLTVGWGAWNATRLRTVDLDLRIPRKSGASERLTVVAASDLHLGALVGPSRLEKVVGRINALEPDIVLFAGDIVDETVTEAIEAKLGGIMRRLKAPLGLFACPGNHEFFSGLERNLACLRACGITVLQDEAVEVGGAMTLLGRRDPSSLAAGRSACRSARSCPGAGRRRTCRSSSSTISRSASKKPRRPGSPSRSRAIPTTVRCSRSTSSTGSIYELNWGYLRKGDTQYYVTSGAGTWGPPVRIGSRAEVVRIRIEFVRTLRRGRKKPGRKAALSPRDPFAGGYFLAGGVADLDWS